MAGLVRPASFIKNVAPALTGWRCFV